MAAILKVVRLARPRIWGHSASRVNTVRAVEVTDHPATSDNTTSSVRVKFPDRVALVAIRWVPTESTKGMGTARIGGTALMPEMHWLTMK